MRVQRWRPYFAEPAVLRRRGLKVLALGRIVLIYTPRNHWSNDL